MASNYEFTEVDSFDAAGKRVSVARRGEEMRIATHGAGGAILALILLDGNERDRFAEAVDRAAMPGQAVSGG